MGMNDGAGKLLPFFMGKQTLSYSAIPELTVRLFTVFKTISIYPQRAKAVQIWVKDWPVRVCRYIWPACDPVTPVIMAEMQLFAWVSLFSSHGPCESAFFVCLVCCKSREIFLPKLQALPIFSYPILCCCKGLNQSITFLVVAHDTLHNVDSTAEYVVSCAARCAGVGVLYILLYWIFIILLVCREQGLASEKMGTCQEGSKREIQNWPWCQQWVLDLCSLLVELLQLFHLSQADVCSWMSILLN